MLRTQDRDTIRITRIIEKIIEDILEKSIEYTDNMLITLVNIQNKQAELPKSMVLNLE